MRVIGGTRELNLHQWSNDWLTADAVEPRANDKPIVLSPLKVQLNPIEVTLLRLDEVEARNDIAAGKTPKTGTFWQEWILSDDGYFKRRMKYGQRPPVRFTGSTET